MYVCINTCACLKHRIVWGLKWDICDTRNGLCANINSLDAIIPIQSKEICLQDNFTGISLYRPTAGLFDDVSRQECF